MDLRSFAIITVVALGVGMGLGLMMQASDPGEDSFNLAHLVSGFCGQSCGFSG